MIFHSYGDVYQRVASLKFLNNTLILDLPLKNLTWLNLQVTWCHMMSQSKQFLMFVALKYHRSDLVRWPGWISCIQNPTSSRFLVVLKAPQVVTDPDPIITATASYWGCNNCVERHARCGCFPGGFGGFGMYILHSDGTHLVKKMCTHSNLTHRNNRNRCYCKIEQCPEPCCNVTWFPRLIHLQVTTS